MAGDDTYLASGQDILDRLLHSRPEERDRLQPYVRRAKAYHNECGCAMSGAFLVTALLLVLIHGVWRHGSFQGGILTQLVLYAAFVLGAGFVGKMIGVSVARIRLALLCRDLQNQFALDGG